MNQKEQIIVWITFILDNENKKRMQEMGRILWVVKKAYRVIYPYKQRLVAKVVSHYYRNNMDVEIREIMEYVKKRGYIDVFNYPFAERYEYYTTDVKKDRESGLLYVEYHGRPMYFSREYRTAKSCIKYLRGLLIEQDADSPHRYVEKGFDVAEGDIVVDAGVAEGNFALAVVKRVSKLILVECDKYWIEALKQTFAPEIASGKVVLIPKMLRDKNNQKEVSLDAIYSKYGEIGFVKMDIEGGEVRALRGGSICMEKSPSIKLAVCAYHTADACRAIRDVFKENQGKYCFRLGHSKGYMYYNFVLHYGLPYLRRGVIRAMKVQKVQKA